MLKTPIHNKSVYIARKISAFDVMIVKKCRPWPQALLTSRGVGDAAAGLGLHFLHMSKGTFSHDAGHILSSGIFAVNNYCRHRSDTRYETWQLIWVCAICDTVQLEIHCRDQMFTNQLIDKVPKVWTCVSSMFMNMNPGFLKLGPVGFFAGN